MKVFVFGGTGFVGRNLKQIRPEWVYLGRRDVNLLDSEAVKNYFDKNISSDDMIVNLAALVGGVKFNMENQLRMLYENIEIQKNIFAGVRQVRPKKIASMLSTCIMPDLVKYPQRDGDVFPMVEKDLSVASPPDSNAGYAYAKKILQFESNIARTEGINSITFTPTNIYGPYDHFESEQSHVVAALIKKVADLNNGDDLLLYGTGEELRQHIYAPDLCRMIVKLLDNYNDEETIFLSTSENVKISDTARDILNAANKSNKIIYPLKHLAGQFRKDVDNSKFMALYPEFKFTPFEEAVKVTYKWYLDRYRSLI